MGWVVSKKRAASLAPNLGPKVVCGRRQIFSDAVGLVQGGVVTSGLEGGFVIYGQATWAQLREIW